VAGRRHDGNRHTKPIERLREPADLDRWLAGAGFPAAARATQRNLRDARCLREAVDGVTRALLAAVPPEPRQLDALNEWARRRPLVAQADARLRLSWSGDDPVRGPLALIAREAIELLTSPDRALIRECAAAPSCSLLHLDRSRAGRRRWCGMERCGSRAKMRSYRRRRRDEART
jgi:predicted RNA-binding Zn ribbon-like protein